MSEELSLKNIEKAKEAELEVFNFVKKVAKEMNQDPDLEVDTYRESKNLVISWGGGPERWAYRIFGEGITYNNYRIVDRHKKDNYSVESKKEDEIIITKH